MMTTTKKEKYSYKTEFVPELSERRSSTVGPGAQPGATGGLCLCCSSSITTTTQVRWLSNRLQKACERVVLNVCTCVEHFLDDHSHLSFEHRVEQLDDEDEAGAEDEQRERQQNQAYGEVWQLSVGEDVLACK